MKCRTIPVDETEHGFIACDEVAIDTLKNLCYIVSELKPYF